MSEEMGGLRLTLDVRHCVSQSWETFCHVLGASDYVAGCSSMADDFKTLVIGSHFHVDSP